MENEELEEEEIVDEEDPDPTFYNVQPAVDTTLAAQAIEQTEKLVQISREAKRLITLAVQGRGDVPALVRYRRVLGNIIKHVGVIKKEALVLKDDIVERRTKGRHPRIAKKKKKQDL